MNFDDLPEVIKFHRKQSELTQKELADLANVGKTVIYEVENGKQTIQLNTLKKILHVLNIKTILESPLMHLMKEDDEKS